jgi:hypothetical protein
MFARLTVRTAIAFPSPLARRALTTTATSRAARVVRQSVARLAPLGVDAALDDAASSDSVLHPKIFDEFALRNRVGLVTGAHRGLGLEAAVALAEAGARVYCVDIAEEPDHEWHAAQDYVRRMGDGRKLEYVRGDVTNQSDMWDVGRMVGDAEGRLDVCVANAGILKPAEDCLEYSAEVFEQVNHCRASF